jgi:hypothetical protein
VGPAHFDRKFKGQSCGLGRLRNQIWIRNFLLHFRNAEELFGGYNFQKTADINNLNLLPYRTDGAFEASCSIKLSAVTAKSNFSKKSRLRKTLKTIVFEMTYLRSQNRHCAKKKSSGGKIRYHVAQPYIRQGRSPDGERLDDIRIVPRRRPTGTSSTTFYKCRERVAF